MHILKIFYFILFLPLLTLPAFAESLKIFVNDKPASRNQILTVIPGDELRFEVETLQTTSKIRFNAEGAYEKSEWLYTKVKNGKRVISFTVPELDINADKAELIKTQTQVKNGNYERSSEDETIRKFASSQTVIIKVVPPSLIASIKHYAEGSNALGILSDRYHKSKGTKRITDLNRNTIPSSKITSDSSKRKNSYRITSLETD